MDPDDFAPPTYNDEPERNRSDNTPPRERERSPRRDDDRGRPAVENNPGNNLHVSGVSNRVTDAELTEVFAAYGKLQKCQIMYDPHSRESRGFAFVTYDRNEDAEAAIAGQNGVELAGRMLSVEKARRGRARTPTPGKYFGPPKSGGPPGRGPPRDDRYPPRDYPPRDYPPRGGGYRGDPYSDRDRYPTRSPPRRDPYDRYGPPPPREYGRYPPPPPRSYRDYSPPPRPSRYDDPPPRRPVYDDGPPPPRRYDDRRY